MLLHLVFSLIGIILTIFIVVGIHESAHFGMARILGIKVLQFSIGFGKALYRWHDKKGTEYIVALIPLGGYVKLLDENENTVPEAEKHLAFNRQPLYKRAAVVAAGPFSNLVLAFILYWIIFITGFKTPIPIIGSIEPHSIAQVAGLKAQQEIISVDGQKTISWAATSMQLVMHTGDRGTLLMQTLASSPHIQTHILNLDSWEMNQLKPDPFSSLGITPYVPEPPLIIGIIVPHSPASGSTLKIGDELLAINNQPLKNWHELIQFIYNNPNHPISFTIKRHHQKLNIPLIIGQQRHLFFQEHGFLGISPSFTYSDNLLRKIQYAPLEALFYSFKEVKELSYLNVILLKKLLTGKLSILSLGGPITIFETAGSSFTYGIIPFLGFLAFLSVALGIINFIPIPGLDGGHLLFQLIEAAMRRPISIRTQMLSYRLGFIFLALVLIQAMTNDILRLWN